MFERFTDRARKVLAEGQAEAIETGIGFMGTEHLLIGMLREGTGVAAVILEEHGVGLDSVREKIAPELAQYLPPSRVDPASALAAIGIDLDAVRAAVEGAFGEGALPDPAARPPFTPRAKQVLELSLDYSLRWRHRYIGTEHLLAGLVKEGEGLAASALRDLGADLDLVYDATKKMAAPEMWAADAAWEDCLALRRQVFEMPDGALKDELRGLLQGFNFAAEEGEAVKAAAATFAERLSAINAAVSGRLQAGQ